MSIRVDCPHCGKSGMAPSERAGKKVKCPACYGVMLIPLPVANISQAPPTATVSQQPTPQQPLPTPSPVVAEFPVIAVSRTKKRKPSLLIAGLFLATLSLGGMAIGYVVLDSFGINLIALLDRKPQEKRKTTPAPTKVSPQRLPEPRIARAQPTPQVVLPKREDRIEPVPFTPVPFTPIPSLPTHIALPSPSETKTVVLLKSPSAESVSIRSIDSRLAHEGNRLLWLDGEDKLLVGGLKLEDEEVIFRWLPGAPAGAVAATHNALLKISLQGDTSSIPMRSPVALEALVFDLKKPVLRIPCKCQYPPDPDSVRFSLVLNSSFPQHRTTGKKPQGLQRGDESFLWYSSADGLATKVTAKKRGNILVAELMTRFRLPSGEEGSLTLTNARKKRTELSRLLEQAKNASSKISQVRMHQYECRRLLSSWQSKSTVGYVNRRRYISPVLVIEKQAGIENAERKLSAANTALAKAERLMQEKPSIERELSALDIISEGAQSLIHAGYIGYRFTFMLDGQVIELAHSDK